MQKKNIFFLNAIILELERVVCIFGLDKVTESDKWWGLAKVTKSNKRVGVSKALFMSDVIYGWPVAIFMWHNCFESITSNLT